MSKIFSHNNVSISDKDIGRKDAIRLCAKPLLDTGDIDESYLDSIFEMAEELGPYFDFGQGIAVPHSRPQDGVRNTCAALLKLNKSVLLMDNPEHPIDVIVIFASVDDESHIGILQEISDIFGEKSNIEEIKNANSVEEILKIFNR
jgi:transcriptional antiterminator, BglG family